MHSHWRDTRWQRWMRGVFLGLVMVSVLGHPLSAASLDKLRLKFSNSPFIQVEVEVARTTAEKAQGLMYRKKLEPDNGMLFVSTSAEPMCMWMKNTLLPLSVAFIDARGRILNIEEMQAQTLTPHCAQGPARYALEMNQGWFAAHQITTGTVVLNLAPQ